MLIACRSNLIYRDAQGCFGVCYQVLSTVSDDGILGGSGHPTNTGTLRLILTLIFRSYQHVGHGILLAIQCPDRSEHYK